MPAHRRDIELAEELTAGLLDACWCDDESAAGRTAVLALLACWLDKESAARQMAVLAHRRNVKSAAGLMALLDRWRNF